MIAPREDAAAAAASPAPAAAADAGETNWVRKMVCNACVYTIMYRI